MIQRQASAAFLPVVAEWFTATYGAATLTQELAWPAIAGGDHVLVAAPTGTGKTLAACLGALDRLWREGANLADATRILYLSPLRALSNDVEQNLLGPIAAVQARDPFLPRITTAVRTGDTPAGDRAKMARKAPHVLVTTPESLHLLLTSNSGRNVLGHVDTVIVDEIHAVAGSKRGSHLSLCLERLSDLVRSNGGREPQRIGLSATQRPLSDIAAFLAGTHRAVEIVDAGHLRRLDLAVEVTGVPLEAVCSHETWGTIYDRIAELAQAHRTTLVFVATRKLAERLAARLSDRLGEEKVGCHHGSLSKERRHEAERKLKAGEYRALVATASLELGIDIGDVELAVQVGSPRAISVFLQRVGRAGHVIHRVPKGRLFPLTADDLVESAGLLDAVARGELDVLRVPLAPLDLLAQQLVAACCDRPRTREGLLQLVTSAWPFRGITATDIDAAVAMHTGDRLSLLVDDAGEIRATDRAKRMAGPNGGAIPDTAVYTCREEPGDAVVGTLDEDFSIESAPGDVFQLGNRSWRILRIEPAAGIVRVVDAHGQSPTIPFWLGEAAGRTRELSLAAGRVRAEATGVDWLKAKGLDSVAAAMAWDHLQSARTVLGALPSQSLVIAERFFDDTGGQQLVVHAPFGGRITRAWALALRKRFCTGFGFELEAAGGDEGFLLSLAPGTSFPLEEIFSYLSPMTVEGIIEQAVLTGGQFETRWRHNVARALLVERTRNGKRTAPHLLRLRANDALARACPSVLACPDNLPAGPRDIPRDHPLVRQTIADCLHELLDTAGLVDVLTAIREGRIATRALDVPEPSVLARGILALGPFAFLDDVPLEERRVRAVAAPRRPVEIPTPGELDPAAVAAVRGECWPQPADENDLVEILGWIGYVTRAEAAPWSPWPERLVAAGRAVYSGEKLHAPGASQDPVAQWRGRLEALGPVVSDDPALLALETEGIAIRCRFEGREQWCHRRLLQRIHRRMREARRSSAEPVDPASLWRFLAAWQGVSGAGGEGVEGLRRSLRQLAGFELTPGAWNAALARRVTQVQARTIDQLTADGSFAWGRLWNGESGRKPPALASTPVAIVPRDELDAWLGLAGPALADLPGEAKQLHRLLLTKGALFPADAARLLKLVPAQIEAAMSDLIATGLATSDQLAGLRWLLLSDDRRRKLPWPGGRLSPWRPAEAPPDVPGQQQSLALFAPETATDRLSSEDHALVFARTLLRRWGVVCFAVIQRERLPIPWRDVLRALRTLELRGDAVGGRFVHGFSGEQYALAEAASRLASFRQPFPSPLTLPASDPLNFTGILVPGARVTAGMERTFAIS